MSIYVILIAVLIVLFFTAVILRGNHRLKKNEKFINDSVTAAGPNAEYLGMIPYHGGFPPIPLLQKLHMVLADNCLLFLFDKDGVSEKLDFNDCRQVDTFTLKQDPAQPGKRISMIGMPYLGFLKKPKYRHFLVIKIMDHQHGMSNVLLEARDQDELRSLSEKITCRI